MNACGTLSWEFHMRNVFPQDVLTPAVQEVRRKSVIKHFEVSAPLHRGATYDIPGLSARALGVIGLVFNYQMLYGTVLYFSNYCLNRYYEKTPWSLVSVVVVANGIWVVGPLAWMWACWDMIRTDSVAIFR